jgi:hypothetical protein
VLYAVALLVSKILNHFLKAKTHSGKIGFQDNGIGQSSADPFFEFPGNAKIIQVFLIFDIIKDFFDQGYDPTLVRACSPHSRAFAKRAYFTVSST